MNRHLTILSPPNKAKMSNWLGWTGVGVHVSGSYAYVAADGEGLFIFRFRGNKLEGNGDE